MKKRLYLLFLTAIISAAAFSICAQQDTGHIARDGDILHPGVAYSPDIILSVDDSTRSVLLDPDAVMFDSTLDASTYLDGDTISYIRSATKHRFVFRSGTLYYLGFENRATHFRLDSAVKVARFPLEDGETIRGKWAGNMLQHGSMVLKRTVGTSSSRAESGWTLTDGTDSLRNTVRLVWTLDMAYADPDSITPEMPYSVASERISEMQVDVSVMLSERLLTERTMWFSEGARYPVLTDSRVSRTVLSEGGAPADTIPLSMLAMHYPTPYQYSDTGEEITAPKKKAANPGSIYGDFEKEDNETGKHLTVEEPETSGDAVTVTMSSPSGPATATVTLFTDSGIRLTEPMEVTVGTVAQRFSVKVPSGWKGVLLLRVEAGEESYTKKTIL